MIRVLGGFFIAMVMISVGTVYNLKDETERLEARKQHLLAKILQDRAAIRVLNAEMAYLSRPERLETLSGRFLALEACTSDQMADNTTSIASRGNFEQASFPIDDFPVLLPQEKPIYQKKPRNIIFSRPVKASVHNQGTLISLVVKEDHVAPKVKTQNTSFYDRISYKLENGE